MPSPVACPVCDTDGTAVANEVIAQTLAAQPAAPAPLGLKLHVAAPPAPSLPPAPVLQDAPPAEVSSAVDPRGLVQSAAREWGPGDEGDKWKWWYYVLAGICIGGYSIWQAYDQQRAKPLGELFLAVFCVAIGIWDFQRKRKSRASG